MGSTPSTTYDFLFHWQSQNAARPDKGRGLSYIQHEERGKQVILFVREQASDERCRAMGFINLGPVCLNSYSGSQPMNITWRLKEPIPPYLWNSAAKLAVG
ncbi:MAG TPA: hypothetical protein DEP78_07335 [Verrucomicrobiales bacterium]|nr:hypothetical protein [Verrucomicrobiales bacterium]